MTVQLTSPVLGKNVGDSYTGTLEDWLLSEGYAKRAGYTGPGVSNTGPAVAYDATKDPTLGENREAPKWPLTAETNATIANDATNLNKKAFPAPGQDVDNDNLVDSADGDPEPDAQPPVTP